jgi:hypothetical protein
VRALFLILLAASVLLPASPARVALAAPDAPAGEEAPAAEEAKPDIERLEDGRYRLGTILIDPEARTLTLPGHANMERGLIEVLACTWRGKVHESLLVLDPETLGGDSLLAWVEWEDAQGAPHRQRAEDLLWNVAAGAPMERTAWRFTGSRMNEEGTFVAQVEGTLLATYYDPFAILNNPLPTRHDDTLYQVRAEGAIPKGTPVTLRLVDAGGPALARD